MKFLVKVEGKLIVEAADKKLAIEKANVFLAEKSLGGFKGNEYYVMSVPLRGTMSTSSWVT